MNILPKEIRNSVIIFEVGLKIEHQFPHRFLSESLMEIWPVQRRSAEFQSMYGHGGCTEDVLPINFRTIQYST